MLFNRLHTDHTFTDKSKHHAIDELVESVRYTADFKVLLIGSILIATGAIFSDSIPVLIASMIIAPLATPILAMGLGVVTRDARMVGRALFILLLSCAFALVIAGVLTFFFSGDMVKDSYISFDGNRTIAAGIALAAGFVGTYGMLSPRVASAVTGVAIAVSLMPPLVAASISFVAGDGEAGLAAGILFLLNVLCILLASIVVFWWFGVGKASRSVKP